MYKIIFIDIDGTLRNDEREISQRTIQSIKNITEKGILVVITSGRPRKYTEDISRECFASPYIITSNGGSIYNYEEEKIIYVNRMDKQACISLYHLAQEKDVRFIMDVGDKRVVNKVKHKDGSEIQLNVGIEEFVNNNTIMQCVVADSDFDKIKSMKQDIEKLQNVRINSQHKSLLDDRVARTGTIYYNVANIEVSKGNAIEKLCTLLKIDLKHAVGIGDDYNDISMFEKVGYSVVMGNANETIKEYANEIIESNNEDGVAVFLEKVLDKLKN